MLYLYFRSILQNAAEVWFHYHLKIQNKSNAYRSKMNSGGLCECRMLSQTNVNWEIQAIMLLKPNIKSSQICCT